MANIVGPKGTNFSLTRPSGEPDVSGGVQTWFKDCTSALTRDGTVPTASWFNDMLAQLRTAIISSGVSQDLNDDMLWRSMQAAAATVLQARRGLIVNAGYVENNLGNLSDISSATLAPTLDRLSLYDASDAITPIKQIAPSELVSGMVVAGSNITVSVNGSGQTVIAAVIPSASSVTQGSII